MQWSWLLRKHRSRPRDSSARRGYAMLVVTVFIGLMLTLAGVAFRHLASSLRIERVREQIRMRDEGAVAAVARAAELLESGTPPISPYTRRTDIITSQGVRAFTVTYTQEAVGEWTIEVHPTTIAELYDALPDTFMVP
ncbi:MAG: hypothetical protein KDA60_08175 [Planctomycetales bacterium]|nr:hypothetical protein [Planctomycetales bacterium]